MKITCAYRDEGYPYANRVGPTVAFEIPQCIKCVKAENHDIYESMV